MKPKKLVSMTLAEKIQYQTSDYLELTCGWLGATPDMPGGCETVARFSLGKKRRLINTDLLDELVVKAEHHAQLLEAAIQARGVLRTVLGEETDATAIGVLERRIQTLTNAIGESK